ncbi:hypothetical protein CHS0354_020158 [Potamilus streckersoni]|uniref:ABC transporter domain-containing protein n=1 Tax=Potamilus streckersoni TaxID=2493646 RepID=A0AAE0S5B7_9BIVA|nr:hypothetical protein CHS0354_020158 [Potamilus streckersoni]
MTDVDSNLDPGETAKAPEGLVFRNVIVHANGTSLLNSVCGAALPGHLLAVMGPSGSGKTSLLNTLSGRLSIDSGEVTLNGIPVDRRIKRKICYVLQNDIFFSNLTLKETLSFTAILRLPEEMPQEDKLDKMMTLAKELGLQRCMDTTMGDTFCPGLSGGEKKRANIACELITDPDVILLDEPTSGLDYGTAFSLIQTLKTYTEHHQKTVVTTIHQPSSQIFFQFDTLLLMCAGHSVYYGNTRDVVDYFASIELPMTSHYNPADFILEKLKSGPEIQEKIIKASYEKRKVLKNTDMLTHDNSLEEIHKDFSAVMGEERDLDQGKWKWREIPGKVLNKLKRKPKPSDTVEEDTGSIHMSLLDLENTTFSRRKWPTKFITQYKQLTLRTFRQSKIRIMNKFKLIETVFLTVLLSLIWFQLPRIEETLRDRMGVLFYISMHWGFTPLFDAVISFPMEKLVINKERAAGWYRLSAYYLAKITTEITLIIVQPIFFLTIVYWSVGLSGPGPFFATMGTIFVHSFVGQTMGLFLGILCMDMRRGISIATVVIMFIMLLGGFYTRNMPVWISWIKYFSFLHYTFHALLYLEFSGGSPIQCAAETGTTSSNFPSCFEGNNTRIPAQDLLQFYRIDLSYWGYFMPLFVFISLFLLLGYVQLRFFQKSK